MSTGWVAVVTGAGPGSLGEATARALREHGRVITTRRSGPATVDFHPLDLADAGSVRAFVDWLGGATDRLDVLVNNAGVHLDLRRKWREPQLLDGHEIHWRTNYLGTAHLTRLLLPILLRTAAMSVRPGSSTSSPSCTPGAATSGSRASVRPYDSWDAYGTSKLALVHEAAEIERRYGDRGLHGYSLHPGAVYTKVADRGLETAPVLGRLRKLARPARAPDADVAGGGSAHQRLLCDLAPTRCRVATTSARRRRTRRRRPPMPRPATALWERTSAWAETRD